jgi:DNA-binding transcriptional MocR family regulator
VRDFYRRNIDVAERILGNRFGFYRPAGGFFLWLDVGDGEAATLRLWREAGLRVLPGKYMTRGPEPTPSDPYIRVALVHPPEVTADGLSRLAQVL